MRLHRVWSACAVLLLAVSVASCAEGQFGQVVQAVGKNMAKGMCAEGGGAASSAPEFCLYFDNLQFVNRDTEAEVSLRLVNRTGRLVYLFLDYPHNSISLLDSSGTKWHFRGSTGVQSNPPAAAVEPGTEIPVTIHFMRSEQTPVANLTFTLRGEMSVPKLDARGEPIVGNGAMTPQVKRSFNFSGIRTVVQPPAQPLQQKSLNPTAPPAVQDASASATSSTIQPATRPVALPVATSSVSSAMPVPGSRTWEGLDIVGLKSGISSDEFQQRLKTNDIPLEIRVTEAELADVPNTRHISHVIGISKGQDPGVGKHEIITASFAPIPNRPAAGVIGRVRAYPIAQQPTLQNVQGALVEKYGPPSYKRSSEVMGFESWVWVFDKDGKQSAGSALKEDCSLFEQVSLTIEKTTYSLFNEDTIMRSIHCGRVLHVRTIKNQKNDLVWQMTTVLVDPFLMEESLAKTGAMVAAYKGKRQEEELQRAQKQGKPKL